MSGGGVIFDPYVEEGKCFSDEDENTSQEENLQDVLQEDDGDLEELMRELNEDDPPAEPLKDVKPVKDVKPLKDVKPKKPKKDDHVILAFGRMVEPVALACVFSSDERAVSLVRAHAEGQPVPHMREEERAFVQRVVQMHSTRHNATCTLADYYEPTLQSVRERLKHNAPMSHILGAIRDGAYREMYVGTAPKQRDTHIVDCFTGAHFDGNKKGTYKDMAFVYFLRDPERAQEPEAYDGFYMSKAAGNLLRLVHTLSCWDSYVEDRVRVAMEQYRNTILKGVTVLSNWDEVYAQLAQGFERKPVTKWKQTKMVVLKDSFVHTIIELRRLLEATL